MKNLYQCHFTAFVSIQEEWNIPILAHFRIHKINRPKADIQTYGTVTVTIARSSVRTFALIGIQLNGNLSFHHLFAEPFQHAEHRITPRIRRTNAPGHLRPSANSHIIDSFCLIPVVMMRTSFAYPFRVLIVLEIRLEDGGRIKADGQTHPDFITCFRRDILACHIAHSQFIVWHVTFSPPPIMFLPSPRIHPCSTRFLQSRITPAYAEQICICQHLFQEFFKSYWTLNVKSSKT